MSDRLFVSVDLDGLAEAVRAVQERFEGASGLHFTDPEQAHVTLKFLGDTDPDRVDALVGGLERAVEDIDPFEARFGGLGVFPSMDYINVVWAGVREGHGDAELTGLHEAIEARTTAMGFDAEAHDFTPHVTLARMDHAGGKEQVQRVVENADPEVGRLCVEDIRLTESVLTDDGPEYRTVESLSL